MCSLMKELVYILYLARGVPKVTFLSIKDAKNSDSNSITAAFGRFDIDMSYHILGLSVDGATVNTSINSG